MSRTLSHRGQFSRYIGIDYSGAGAPDSPQPGLAVFAAVPEREPSCVKPSPARKWNRKGLAAWLVDQLAGSEPVIVGIDHAFSFPQSYLDRYHLRSWDEFLDDFCEHYPTCTRPVQDCREGNSRCGEPCELRLADRWTSSAKSVFLFDVNGSVAKSSHAGIPWLHFLRRHERLQGRVHFWPFDGFEIMGGRSVVAEVYPSIFRNRYPKPGNSSVHERDAHATARWLRDMDQNGFLERYFDPPLTEAERDVVRREGWILGVG